MTDEVRPPEDLHMRADSPDIDALFQLPLEQFTAARNTLASRMKAAGHAEAALRVKALAKPPLSAWAVNQLYWRHRKAFDALLAAGDRLRRVQASSLRAAGVKDGGLRDAMEVRRAALAELTTRAGALLEAAGHAPTPDVTRRITTTLDALATYGQQPDGPRPGRLTDDVDAPGIEALASLVNGGRTRASGPSRVIPFAAQRDAGRKGATPDPAAEKRRRDAERKQLAAAVRDAERALTEARKTAARAEAALKAAAARAKAAAQRKEALTARFEQLSADAERTRQEARQVAAKAEEAAQAVTDAERALEDARRARDARD